MVQMLNYKVFWLQESEILKYFTSKEELEPLAENCTKVYVWHTRTQKPSILNPKKLKHPPLPDDHIEVWFHCNIWILLLSVERNWSYLKYVIDISNPLSRHHNLSKHELFGSSEFFEIVFRNMNFSGHQNFSSTRQRIALSWTWH